AANYNQVLLKLAVRRAAESDFTSPLLRRLKQTESNLTRALHDLPRVQKLLDRKDPEQAQQLFWRLMDPVDQATLWYGMKNMPLQPVALTYANPTRNKCDTATQALWNGKALQACNKQLAEAT